jgi:hypothetical protein
MDLKNHNNMVFSNVHQVKQKQVNPDSLFSWKASSLELPHSLYQDSEVTLWSQCLCSKILSPFAILSNDTHAVWKLTSVNPTLFWQIHKLQYHKAGVNPLEALTWLEGNIHSPHTASNLPNSKFLTSSMQTKALPVFSIPNKVIRKCAGHNQNNIMIQTNNTRLQNNPYLV